MTRAETPCQGFVAVVDDDAAVCKAIQKLLEAYGFATCGYSSAEQLLGSEHYALAGCLVLDVQLPGMSGPQLHRRLRAQGSVVPVIYCSSAQGSDGELRRMLLQAGALAVLGKPFEAEQLLRPVREALRAS